MKPSAELTRLTCHGQRYARHSHRSGFNHVHFRAWPDWPLCAVETFPLCQKTKDIDPISNIKEARGTNRNATERRNVGASVPLIPQLAVAHKGLPLPDGGPHFFCTLVQLVMKRTAIVLKARTSVIPTDLVRRFYSISRRTFFAPTANMRACGSVPLSRSLSCLP